MRDARRDPVCQPQHVRLHHRAGHPGQEIIQEEGQKEAEELSPWVGGLFDLFSNVEDPNISSYVAVTALPKSFLFPDVLR